jgi:hypothetical protein
MSIQQVSSNLIGSLATTKLTGRVPVANAPLGSVIQVVYGTTSTRVDFATQTYTDTTLSATITPLNTANKIIVLASHHYYSSGGMVMGIRILRNSTTIYSPPADGVGPYEFEEKGTGAVASRANLQIIDFPSSTSALTYKTQARRYVSGNPSFSLNGDGALGTLILMEIAG